MQSPVITAALVWTDRNELCAIITVKSSEFGNIWFCDSVSQNIELYNIMNNKQNNKNVAII